MPCCFQAEAHAPAIGTQFGIFTFRDHDGPVRREALMQIALDCWREVAEHAKARGLSYLFWEPMSVGRELGHTIRDCQALQNWIDAGELAIPLRPMVDIDHGDVTSPIPPISTPMPGQKILQRNPPSSTSSKAP